MYLTASLYANIFCHLHIVPKKFGWKLAMTVRFARLVKVM